MELVLLPLVFESAVVWEEMLSLILILYSVTSGNLT